MKDHTDVATLAAGSDSQLEHEKLSWVEKASRWLKRKLGQDGGEKDAPLRKKRRRTKSYEMLCSMHNALMQTCGFGLGRFQAQADSELYSRPFDWPFASCAADQGPDMLCGLNFLQFKPGVNIARVDDLSHGCWNDVRKALKANDLWPRILMMIVAYNVPYGSQLSPSRLKQLREAVVEYQGVASPGRCPIFAYYLPLIMEDLGRPPNAADEEWVDQLWAGLPDHDILWKKGDKVGLSRFFAVVYKNKAESSDWNTRALFLTSACSSAI